MYIKPTLTVAAAFTLWSAVANAGAFEDTIIQRYKDMGFQFIEIDQGPTQTKVEAIMPDGRKVEVIYDRATGKILKQENERADSREIARTGVEYDHDDDDFLDDDDNDDEDDHDDDHDDDDDGDDDHESDHDDGDDHGDDDDDGSDDDDGDDD